MKTLLTYLILIFAIQHSYSQIEPEWIVRNDLGYSAHAITVDNLGNVYVAGHGTGFITIKYNSSGVLQWVQTNMGGEVANAIVTDNSGNVYVTGQTSSVNPDYDYLTIKYDSNGVQQWVRTYNASIGHDKAYSIVADNFGNVYVTGSSYSADGPPTGVYSDDNNKQDKIIQSDTESTGYDFATIKYSSGGEQLWVQRYNSSVDHDDHALAIVIDSSGNVYVTGSANDGIATLKYSTTGAQLWVKTHSGSVSSIALDQKDNVYVVGSNNSDCITIKYTSNGTQQWVKTYNGSGNSYDNGNSVAVGTSGNVYVTGSTTGSGTGSDYATIKYDSAGVQQWVKRYNGKVNGMDAPRSVGLDALENVYVTGQSTENGIYTDYTTIKYNLNGEEHWVHSYNGPGNNNDFAIGLALDNSGNVYVTGSSWGSNGYRIATIKYPGVRYPVFIVPGIAGTYAADTENDLGWIMNRGVSPEALQIDPLGKVYHDMITTYENLGYEQGKNLFVVNYDWRLIPGPMDNNIDGHINGLSGVSITSGQFNYGVDYLGWYIKQACERFRQDYGMELDSIDVIAHSTGGLVTRTYIQSNAYGDIYDISNNYKLPKIRNFVMIGVPNRGASKAWNPINDNWIADYIYRFILAKIINTAYQKVLQNQTIIGPDYNIAKSDILDSLGNPVKAKFVNKYVPTLRGLLATYEFIDFGSGYIDVNNNTDQRNTFVLDLNDGLDLYANADPNKFLDSTKLSVIYGTGIATFDLVKQRNDDEIAAVHSFSDWLPSTVSSSTIWFKDISSGNNNGDETVPTISAAGQFINDNRANKLPFNSGTHTKLVSMVTVQSSILDLLNIPFTENNISTGSGADISNVLNVISDPVELFITDGSGNRLGYSNTTGAITEIPNSIWFGNTDGRGWVFGPVQEPISLQLTGLGEDYYVMVSVEDQGKGGGVVLEGFLGLGEVINYQITLDPLSVDQLKSLTPDNFELAQNYPNPFNPNTVISYHLPVTSHVTLKVYDLLGNEVVTLVNESKPTGFYEVSLNASNLSSGVYFYKFQAENFVETKKMILLR